MKLNPFLINPTTNYFKWLNLSFKDKKAELVQPVKFNPKTLFKGKLETVTF